MLSITEKKDPKNVVGRPALCTRGYCGLSVTSAMQKNLFCAVLSLMLQQLGVCFAVDRINVAKSEA